MSVRVRFPSRAHSPPCTVFFVHGFFCARLLLCPASFARLLCAGFGQSLPAGSSRRCFVQQQFSEQVFLAESGTLPHRPWTPMSLVNGKGPQAKRCGRDEAKRKSVRKSCRSAGDSALSALEGAPKNHYREKLAGKSAQKCQFCARKVGIGTRERGNWHREAQPLPSCKSPSTLSKCKCLITR